jgi:hypothetical protein
MSPSSAELRERIEMLLSSRDASLDEVEEALTAGYGYALSLDSQRLRIERRITELAAHAEDPETAGELRKLWLRSRTLTSELSDLRALLGQLKNERLPAAR